VLTKANLNSCLGRLARRLPEHSYQGGEQLAKTKYWGYRRTLSTDEVMQIRRRLVSTTFGKLDFGQVEPLDPGALDSAVARQNTGYGGEQKYNRPHELAASLFYGIAMNHAFENGNKRTALVSALVSLNFNNSMLVGTTQEDLYRMATSVVAHEFELRTGVIRTPDTEVAALASWLRQRIVRRTKLGDKAIDMVELRELLEARGCVFGSPSKNYISIYHGRTKVKTGYPKASFTVPVAEVKRIRRALELTDMESEEFYDIDLNVDKFVREYGEVLYWLADA
jgi:death-on-curing family protein